MKKVYFLLVLAICFITLDFSGTRIALFAPFIGGIGLGTAVIEARLQGRKEGRAEK